MAKQNYGVEAVLTAAAVVPAGTTYGEYRTQGWAWEDMPPARFIPSAYRDASCIPGTGPDGCGYFVVESMEHRSGYDFMGKAKLHIGERTYSELDLGLFPVTFGGRLVVPVQQMIYVELRIHAAIEPPKIPTTITVRLVGKWWERAASAAFDK